MAANVEEKTIEVIAKWLEVPKDEVTRDASIFEDLGADSLDAVQIVLELEKEFGLEISDEEADQITTVGDAIDYILEHLKEE